MKHFTVSPGTDPRQEPTYRQLRDEVSRLLHPARPDVNWRIIETQCLKLFRTHGVDLRSMAWYTAARFRRGGLNGFAEGLALLDILISRHWSVLWPQLTVSRQEILSWLAAQIQHELHRFVPDEQECRALTTVVQTLQDITAALKNTEPSIHSPFQRVIAQLKCIQPPLSKTQVAMECAELLPVATGAYFQRDALSQEDVSDAHETALIIQEAVTRPSRPFYLSGSWWEGLVSGCVLMVLLSAATGWLMSGSKQNEAFLLRTVVLPTDPLSVVQAAGLKMSLPARDLQAIKPVLAAQTKRYLDRILSTGPDVAQRNMRDVLMQMEILWPDDKEFRYLRNQWLQTTTRWCEEEDKHIYAWRETSNRVDNLLMRLNSKGIGTGGDELKMIVSDIRRSLDALSPVEAFLVKIETLKRTGEVVPADLYEQARMRMQQQIGYMAQLTPESTLK